MKARVLIYKPFPPFLLCRIQVHIFKSSLRNALRNFIYRQDITENLNYKKRLPQLQMQFLWSLSYFFPLFNIFYYVQNR